MPALERATRRVHCGDIEAEDVTARNSRAIIPRRRPARRPTVAVDASDPESTITWINIPAAHEVG